MAKVFWAADYYVLLQWNVRPAAVGRMSCCCGTYVLLPWDVIIHRIKSLSLRKENAKSDRWSDFLSKETALVISYICWLDIIIIYFHFANDESKNKGIQMPYWLIFSLFHLTD